MREEKEVSVMVEELVEYLDECETEVVAVEQLALPLQAEGKHRILVLPGYNLLEMMEEVCEEAETLSAFVAQQLEEARSLSVEDAFRKIVESRLVYTDLPVEEKQLQGKNFSECYQAYAAMWEGSELVHEQLVATEASTEPFQLDREWAQDRIEDGDSLVVLNLPQERGHEAPLWIPMGGYNECPLPVYQSVIFKHFQEQYGASILAVTGDTWVLQAKRRPQTAEEALQLAKEHFIFCQYVLDDQQTLGHYADYLLKQDVWYFWWD
jgi:hypothetical protein